MKKNAGNFVEKQKEGLGEKRKVPEGVTPKKIEPEISRYDHCTVKRIKINYNNESLDEIVQAEYFLLYFVESNYET